MEGCELRRVFGLGLLPVLGASNIMTSLPTCVQRQAPISCGLQSHMARKVSGYNIRIRVSCCGWWTKMGKPGNAILTQEQVKKRGRLPRDCLVGRGLVLYMSVVVNGKTSHACLHGWVKAAVLSLHRPQ